MEGGLWEKEGREEGRDGAGGKERELGTDVAVSKGLQNGASLHLGTDGLGKSFYCLDNTSAHYPSVDHFFYLLKCL